MSSRNPDLKRSIEELTRRAILAAGADVLSDVGPADFTMDRVAEQAGVGKGTLYLHFSNKEALLDETVCFLFAPLEEEYDAILASDLDPIRKIERTLLVSVEFTDLHRTLLHQLRHEIFRPSYLEDPETDCWYQDFLERFGAMFDAAAREGNLRPLDGRVAAGHLIGVINSLIYQRVMLEEGAPPEDAIRASLDLLIHGLAPWDRSPETDPISEG